MAERRKIQILNAADFAMISNGLSSREDSPSEDVQGGSENGRFPLSHGENRGWRPLGSASLSKNLELASKLGVPAVSRRQLQRLRASTHRQMNLDRFLLVPSPDIS